MEADFSFLRQTQPGAEASAEKRLEKRVMRRILRYYNVGVSFSQLERSVQQEGGRGLSFSAFLDRFPTFPLFISCRRIGYLHQLTMADWLRRFSRTPAFVAFTQALDEIPEPWLSQEKALALVFPLYNMGAGLGCLTNYETPLREASARIVHKSRNKLYTFSTFFELLDSAAWSP